jgi:hypothetical protein
MGRFRRRFESAPVWRRRPLRQPAVELSAAPRCRNSWSRTDGSSRAAAHGLP